VASGAFSRSSLPRALAVPADTRQVWVDEFFDGFLALADRYETTLAGGDISQSQGGIVADVMVIGSAKRGRAVLRSTAKVNDIIYVTGALGGSAATLDTLFAGKQLPQGASTQRHFYPEPRIMAGAFLARRKLARVMIDCSDGLSVDLAHICEESAVGAILNRALLPVASGATLEHALHGGEDYELIFTAPASAKVPIQIECVPITEIGWIARERGIYITDLRTKPQPLEARGWQHFRSGS
jgi:thiamine-monophosphate kinase